MTDTIATPAAQPSAGACSLCSRPARDGIMQPGVGLLCEQCADLRHDAYLDWYDQR